LNKNFVIKNNFIKIKDVKVNLAYRAIKKKLEN